LAPKPEEEKQSLSPEMSVVHSIQDETYPAGIAELSYEDGRIIPSELDEICRPVNRVELSTETYGSAEYFWGGQMETFNLHHNIEEHQQVDSYQLTAELDSTTKVSELPAPYSPGILTGYRMEDNRSNSVEVTDGIRETEGNIFGTSRLTSTVSLSLPLLQTSSPGLNLCDSSNYRNKQLCDRISPFTATPPMNHNKWQEVLYEGTQTLELEFTGMDPVSPVSPLWSYPRSNGLWKTSQSSVEWSTPSLSTTNNSMSSLDYLPEQPGYLCDKPAVPFFDQTSMLFDEPDTMEHSLTQPKLDTPADPSYGHHAALKNVLGFDNGILFDYTRATYSKDVQGFQYQP
jgi:hypothetical protein